MDDIIIKDRTPQELLDKFLVRSPLVADREGSYCGRAQAQHLHLACSLVWGKLYSSNSMTPSAVTHWGR